MFLRHKITEKAIALIESHELWQDAINIARRNCYGRVYLVGGALYKTLAAVIHDFEPPPIKDFDFLIDGVPDRIWLPQNKLIATGIPFGGLRIKNKMWSWRHTDQQLPLPMPYDSTENPLKARYPNSERARNGDFHIDLLAAPDVRKLAKVGEETNLRKAYCKAVPLDIQQVVYDIEADRLYCDGAIKALTTRQIGVSNLNNINYDAYMSAATYAAEKALGLHKFRSIKNTLEKCKCTHNLLDYGCLCGGR